ncbi:MAG: hypothetical protein U1E02_10275, partial [Hydrogenophaga sp.]|nr:hypothetical protein [Hydrogenophaga sp.]
GAQLLDLTISCTGLADISVNNPGTSGVNGRMAVKNVAPNVLIKGCNIQGARGQGYNRTDALNITFNQSLGSGGGGIENAGSSLQVEDSTVIGGAGGAINVISSSGQSRVGFAGTATAGTGGVGIANSGINMQVINSTVAGGIGGTITSIAYSYSYAGYSSGGTARTGAGGAGITNSGINMQVSNSIVTGGVAGAIIASTSTATGALIGYSIGTSSCTATAYAGGAGIDNAGVDMQIAYSTVTGGSGGAIISFSYSVSVGYSEGTGSGTATAGAGGAGINNNNSGISMQIRDSVVTGGVGGAITVSSSPSVVRVGYSFSVGSGTATAGAGGAGITNAGINMQVKACRVYAAMGGALNVTSTSNAFVGRSNNGTARAGAGGVGIENSGLNSFFSGNVISAATAGTLAVIAQSARVGSANGAFGGHAIACTSACSNVFITNCLIMESGQGGNGYRGTENWNLTYPGNGGNGGNGIQIAAGCQNIQIKECRVQVLGAGGAAASEQIAGFVGKLVADGQTCPTSVRSLVFSCADTAV